MIFEKQSVRIIALLAISCPQWNQLGVRAHNIMNLEKDFHPQPKHFSYNRLTHTTNSLYSTYLASNTLYTNHIRLTTSS